MLSILIEKTERHSAQAPALRERYHKSSIVNIQFPDQAGFTLRYNRLVRVGYYEGIDSVAVIGNYLPRQCGIATFTTDLMEGLSAEAPDIKCWAAAMNDTPKGFSYPERIRFEINQNNELVIPYAMSDINSGIATVAVNELLDFMRVVA